MMLALLAGIFGTRRTFAGCERILAVIEIAPLLRFVALSSENRERDFPRLLKGEKSGLGFRPAGLRE